MSQFLKTSLNVLVTATLQWSCSLPTPPRPPSGLKSETIWSSCAQVPFIVENNSNDHDKQISFSYKKETTEEAGKRPRTSQEGRPERDHPPFPAGPRMSKDLGSGGRCRKSGESWGPAAGAAEASGGDSKGCGLPGQPPWPPPQHYPNQFAAPSTLPSKPVCQLCVTSGSTVRWLSKARAVLLDNTGMGRAPPRRQSPSEFRAELS